MDRNIYLVGLNHRSADVAIREGFALPENGCIPGGSCLLDDALCEYVALSTCNRVEITLVARDETVVSRLVAHWAASCGKSMEDLEGHIYVHSGLEAVRHLFAVASGLDSLVLGEPQILGQMKAAYKRSVEEGTAKVICNRLFHKAFMTAKRVRTETAVAASAVSVSSAAVALARRIFGDLEDRPVLLIGAGKMAELAATHLVAGQGARIRVTNRTLERAEALAVRFKGEAAAFTHLEESLSGADIVISSTGAAEPIINLQLMSRVMRKRKNRPVFLIDIAVPRDIEAAVNNLDNVYLYNIDDLGQVVASNQESRREEAGRAAVIINEEVARFRSWLDSLYLQPTIADLVQRSERIAQAELARTLKRIGPVDEATEKALEQMLVSVIKKLNHDPITFLQRRIAEKEAGPRYLDFARRLFNLDREKAPVNAHSDRKLQ